jgi:predicted nucleic acid-binding protein
VVIDTDVYGAVLALGSTLAALYQPVLAGRPAIISCQTVAKLRYGAVLRRWGGARMLRLDARISAAEIVHSGPALIATDAQLRVECQRASHALAQREPDADRWIAATAVRLNVPLVFHDRVFENGSRSPTSEPGFRPRVIKCEGHMTTTGS